MLNFTKTEKGENLDFHASLSMDRSAEKYESRKMKEIYNLVVGSINQRKRKEDDAAGIREISGRSKQ